MIDVWYLAGMSLLLVIGMLLVAHRARTRLAPARDAVHEYERVEHLLTPAERSLFGVLKQIAGTDFEVFAKVRIADVLRACEALDPPRRRAASDRIASRCLDFVVCAPDDLRILCAIELDDAGERRDARRERDAFVELACAESGLPLVRIPAAAHYSPAAISERIGAAVQAPRE